jgi:hypothetical protein
VGSLRLIPRWKGALVLPDGSDATRADLSRSAGRGRVRESRRLAMPPGRRMNGRPSDAFCDALQQFVPVSARGFIRRFKGRYSDRRSLAVEHLDNRSAFVSQQKPMEAWIMKTFNLALLAVIATSLAACSETAVVPSESQPSAVSYGEGSTQDLAGSDTVRFSITIDPNRNTYYYLGAGNSITFPEGSLCNPYKSSYGQNEWDKPCTIATSPLTVNVRAFLDKKGNPRVDFDKEIRFAPSTNPNKWVVITFASMQAALDPFYNILYCQNINSSCKDESKKDPSLVTVRNPITGKVTRRIKHFSGYNVAAGEEGMFNLIGDPPGMSISVEDFRFDSVDAVRSHFNVSDQEAREMLDRIRAGRALSGYILASGYEQ